VLTLLKWAFTLAITLLLSGCADPIADAKKNLEANLLDNPDVDYRNVQSFPLDVVCGEVNALDRWGKGTGYQRFIVRSDQVDRKPSDDDWMVFCSEDPAASLQARFNTGPVNRTNSNLLAIHQDLNALDQALNQYFDAHHTYPATKAGLQSLITRQLAKSGKTVGYIEQIPEDPWGRPYLYEKPRHLHPAPRVYHLQTLGRDGVEGGTGEDADIGKRHLKYLNHIYNR